MSWRSVRLALAMFCCLGAQMTAQLTPEARGRLEKASELAASDNFAQAEEILTALVKSAPADAQARYQLGLVLMRQRKVKVAGDTWKRPRSSIHRLR